MDQRAPGNVQLRDVTEADLPILFAQQLDPIATQMAAFPARDWPAYMAHYTKIRNDPTAIMQTILCDGQVAGNIGSWEQSGEREVGYWIGREFWGRGIASAALAALLHQVAARPLYAHVVKHNRGSLRVLEKCGFVIIGEEKDPPDEHGQQIEAFMLKLSATEQSR